MKIKFVTGGLTPLSLDDALCSFLDKIKSVQSLEKILKPNFQYLKEIFCIDYRKNNLVTKSIQV